MRERIITAKWIDIYRQTLIQNDLRSDFLCRIAAPIHKKLTIKLLQYVRNGIILFL